MNPITVPPELAKEWIANNDHYELYGENVKGPNTAMFHCIKSQLPRQQAVNDVYTCMPKAGENCFYSDTERRIHSFTWRGYLEQEVIFRHQLITRTREGQERIQAKQNAYVELVRLCLAAGGALEWSEEYQFSPQMYHDEVTVTDCISGHFHFKAAFEAVAFAKIPTNLHLLNIYYGREK